MIVPAKRQGFSTYKGRKRRRLLRILAVMSALALVTTAGIVLAGRTELMQTILAPENGKKSALELWREKNFSEIINETRERLRTNAMDAEALVFNGFASFYTGVSQATAEEKIPYLEQAIVSLRRARLVRNAPLPGQTDYVLAKAYFHKGSRYFDLTAAYMTSAMQKGFTGEDSHEYLGLAYSGLGRHEDSLRYFKAAIEKRPTDLLLLSLAQTYHHMGDAAAAEDYLGRTLAQSSDPTIQVKAHHLLADIAFARKDFAKAEAAYLAVLELDGRSIAAQFNLGETYLALGDQARARAAWRKTLRLDPQHNGALRRLFR